MSEKSFAGLSAILLNARQDGHDLEYYIRWAWSIGRVAVVYDPRTSEYWIARQVEKRFLWWRWDAVELVRR